MDINQRILNKLIAFKTCTNREGTTVFLGRTEFMAYRAWVAYEDASSEQIFVEGGVNVAIKHQPQLNSDITVV